jgi:undecaprenyl-diphosphatase
MNAIDLRLLLGLNHFAHRWITVDAFIVEVGGSDLLKGGVALGVIWWLWFSPRPDSRAIRGRLLATLEGGFVAVIVGRLLANLLPFRLRPIHQQGLGFVHPYHEYPDVLRTWSSFPSDHAMLFTALAVGVLFVSRKAGAFLLIWTALVIALPRLYLGLHYPSDVVAGALIGAAIACLMQAGRLREHLTRPLVRWLDRHPASFYAAMYVVAFQIGTLFTELRSIVTMVDIMLRHHAA